jgi:hypothetical protein
MHLLDDKALVFPSPNKTQQGPGPGLGPVRVRFGGLDLDDTSAHPPSHTWNMGYEDVDLVLTCYSP